MPRKLSLLSIYAYEYASILIGSVQETRVVSPHLQLLVNV